MAQFDVSAARSKFPALSQDQVFFDNAGGSQTLGTVVDSIHKYLTNNNVQLGATYRVGQLATARYNDGFAAAAKYVNAQEDEIGTLPLFIVSPCGCPSCTSIDSPAIWDGW